MNAVVTDAVDPTQHGCETPTHLSRSRLKWQHDRRTVARIYNLEFR
jgi:hypothetical protein